MKYIVYPGAFIAALCLTTHVKADSASALPPRKATPVMVYAQADPQPEAPVAPAKPDAPIDQDPQSRIRTAREKSDARAAQQSRLAQTQSDVVKVQANLAQAQADRAQAEMQRVQDELNRANAEFQRAGASFDNWTGTLNGLGSHPDRGVVIRTTETDPKNITAAQEDLAVMGRILEKAISQSSEDDDHRAMGIRINLNIQMGAKNMLIEGYGALFMLNVNFPLTGPVEKTEEADSKEPVNSTWEETKHELYGQPNGGKHDRMSLNDYDPKRVDRLKDSLIEALKNANNMKSLKSDENVMVVVSSGGRNDRIEPIVSFMQSFPSAVSTGGGAVPSPKPQIGSVRNMHSGNGVVSTLTICARKSDIDAFAKGKLSPAEFRNKAQVLIY